MKRWKWIILVLLLTVALAACGEKLEEVPEVPALVEDEPPEGLPEQIPEEESPGGEDSLLHAVDAELGGGVSGCLELYGKAVNEFDWGGCNWGVRYMTWTPEGAEEPVCTFYARDANEDAWAGLDMSGEWMEYTEAWNQDGGLRLEDLNFDGYLDISLQAWITANNLAYYHWLYDPDTGQFAYAFSSNMLDTVDAEKKLLICTPHSGAEYDTEYYGYDENGELYLAHRNTLEYPIGDLPNKKTSVNEYYDGPALTRLTPEELAEFSGYFNAAEHNGLLRFPYRDASEAALYLDILFYDDSGSAADMTSEEYAAVEAAGVFTELDMRKLTTDYVLEYLQKNFDIERTEAEEILANGGKWLGTCLPEYDAWYSCRGDTEMQTYTFTDGCRFRDGSVQLYYTAGALYCDRQYATADAPDALLTLEEPMHIQLRPDGSGGWYAARNMMDGSY